MGNFGIVNWIVLLVYFGAMLFLGSRVGKSNNSTESYFLGSRKIPWWAIGLSVMATQCSAVSFIGMPGWGYTSGLMRLTYTFQFPLVMVILMVTFVPFFYNTKVVSIYEYLEKRFGSKSRTFMSVIFLLSRGLQTAVVLFGPALALSMITGLDFSFSLKNPYSFWGGLLGSGFLYITYLGTDQSQIQRVLTAKSIRETKLSLSLAGFIVPIQTLLFLIAGICLFTAFGGQAFENSDYVMLTFITQYLPAGIAGLVTAGVFAAGMSSVDSALNALATVATTDFYKKWKPEADDAQCLKVSRYMTLFFGVFATIAALFLGGLGSILDLINVIGPLFYPCMLSAFTLAVFCKKGNEKGCITAIVTGLVVDVFMWKCTDIGSLWWNFFGFVVAFAAGYIVSVLTNREKAAAVGGDFDFATASGSELTIDHVVKMAVAGKIEEKDEDGYYVVPGKLDKIGYALIAFFVVQCVILALI